MESRIVARERVMVSTALTVIALLCVSPLAFGFSYGTTPTPTMNFTVSRVDLSGGTIPAVEPYVAAGGPNVYAAWLANDSGSYKVSFRASNNYGQTFNSVYIVSCPASNQSCRTGVSKTGNIQMVAQGTSNVAIVWKQRNGVFESASSDSGATWTTPVDVTASLSGNASSPVDAMGGSHLYVSWVQSPTTGNQQIYFINFSNYGQTISPGGPLDLSTGGSATLGKNTEDVIAASGSCVYAEWDVGYFSRSCSNGAKGTWSAPVQINQCCGTSAKEPQIAANGTNVYVTWTSLKTGKFEAYIMVSNNSGTSYINHNFKTIVLTVNFATARELQVSAWGKVVAITYFAQNQTGPVNQWISVSTNGGNSFSKPHDLLVQKRNQPGFGGVLVYNSNIYTFWPHDSSGSVQAMFFETSADSGSTWAGSNPSPISNGTSTGMMSNCGNVCDNGPMLAASGTHVYLVWQQTLPNKVNVTMFSAS